MENYIDAAFEEKKQEPAAEETRVTRRPFATWEVGGETYRMKLSTADVQELEQRYKTNLMNIMATDDDTGMPALSIMLDVAQQAMQRYHHGMTRAKIMDLFDQYVEEGGSQFDFYVNVFTNIFLVSGFFSKARVQKMENVQANLNDGAEV